VPRGGGGGGAAGGGLGPGALEVACGSAGRALADALRPILADYDAALLDCPPSLGLLLLMALIAADDAHVPVAPGGADPRDAGGCWRRSTGCARAAALRQTSTGVVVTRGRHDRRAGGDARQPGA
jgi:hypothetical protein